MFLSGQRQDVTERNRNREKLEKIAEQLALQNELLEKKNIAELDKKIMQELIDEHKYGRKTVKELVEAKEKYLQGQTGALEVILEKLNALVNFYPEHIEKEDKVFFPATEEYFSQEERDAMLEEFWEFDKEMIHEKYRSLVKHLQKEKS